MVDYKKKKKTGEWKYLVIYDRDGVKSIIDEASSKKDALRIEEGIRDNIAYGDVTIKKVRKE